MYYPNRKGEMMLNDSDEGEGYGEERSYFIGPCTCPPNCPSRDEPEGHTWGSCREEECPCEAGWEE
jgi:hypothetical protein